MKRTIIVLTALISVSMLMFVGCKKEGIQTLRGQVKNVELHKDTLVSMTVTINEQGDTALFCLDDARFQNGVMMFRDSVIVDYIYGSNDMLRALVVTVLPKIRKFDEPVFIDTLITKPTMAD